MNQVKQERGYGYSRLVGCIYVFNLIVGTGALSLPKAFQEAGWLLSGIVLSALCVLSYITSTYVIEAMSISNGLQKLSKLKYAFSNGGSPFTADDIEDEATKTLFTYNRNYGLTHDDDEISVTSQSNEILIPKSNEELKSSTYFEILDVYEMGQMAIIYFNRVGLVLFYLSMCIYLYGDLAVYAAAVPTTIRDVSCTYVKNSTENSSFTPIIHISDSDPCWPNSSISRINAYRLFLTAFVLLLCPFIFFNLTKTKLIQYATLSMRWFAFGLMFALMSIYLANGHRYGRSTIANFSKSPDLLGICIYSFMCHHSLPSLVTPIRNKNKMFLLFFINFVIILCFYLLLSLLSTFTFTNIQSLITLNFIPSGSESQPLITDIGFFQYYLSLFPVFSISASFPIIGITLRNNLRNLITCGTGKRYNNWFFEKMFYPLLAIIPPIAVAYGTNNITFLIGFTGSYAGTFIQYVIPIGLVLCARRSVNIFLAKFNEHSEGNIDVTKDQLYQPYQSPFKHNAWAILILIWSGISIVFVTVNHFLSNSTH